MPSKSKSRTTTSGARRLTPNDTGRRLPRHRPPTHPGEVLREEFLRPLGITQAAFAVRLGIPCGRLNEIVRGNRPVTPEIALRLERLLGMTADFWLGLQMDRDLWYAMQGEQGAAISRLQPLASLSVVG